MLSTKPDTGDDFDDLEDAIPATKLSTDKTSPTASKDEPTSTGSDGMRTEMHLLFRLDRIFKVLIVFFTS